MYNIDEINIRFQHLRLFELLNKETKGELVSFDGTPLSPLEDSMFIETIICLIPTQSLYLNGSNKIWTIIDGTKRLSILKSFVNCDFKLTDCKYFTNLEDKYFDEIDGYLKTRILNYTFSTNIINPGVPTSIIFDIYKRVNKKV